MTDFDKSDREQSADNNAAAVAASDMASNERADLKQQAAVNQALTNDHIDRLVEASKKQTKSNELLALATVEYQERAKLARRRFRITMITLGIVAVAVLTSIFVVLVKVNDSLGAAQRGRNQIRDCIIPTGQCFKNGQKRTADVLTKVNQIVVYAAACAPDYVQLPLPQRTIAIQGCIQSKLTK